jgi:hypothetical protein
MRMHRITIFLTLHNFRKGGKGVLKQFLSDFFKSSCIPPAKVAGCSGEIARSSASGAGHARFFMQKTH